MTTTTRTEMMKIADKAAAYITSLNGEADTFEIESNGITAVVSYEAKISEDAGDRWTAPSWWIESETANVEAVYNAEGEDDAEAAEWLQKMLN